MTLTFVISITVWFCVSISFVSAVYSRFCSLTGMKSQLWILMNILYFSTFLSFPCLMNNVLFNCMQLQKCTMVLFISSTKINHLGE